MIDWFTIAVIVAFAILLMAFVTTMKNFTDERNLVLKLLLTGSLIVIAIYLGAKNDWKHCNYLIAGIIASLFGDLLLGLFRKSELSNWNYYLLGVVFFLVAQIMYLTHISMRSDTLPIVGFILAVIGVAGFMFLNKDIVFKNKYALYSMPYSLVLITTMFASIVCLFNGHLNLANGMFAVGIILFFVSDAVLFDLVFKKYDLNKDYINKISYFVGQLLIVLSLM